MDIVSVGSFQKKIQVSIPADKVRAELDRAYQQLSKRAKIPGFRAGKVPRPVLELRFGDQVIGDVANSLIQQSWTDAIAQHKLTPVGKPEVAPGELETGKAFEFTITVDVRPEVTLSTYEGLEVEFPKAEAADEEVEKAVRARLESQAKLVEVTDRAAAKGDLVMVELTAKDGDETVATEPGTMIRTEGDPYFPGAEALVEGAAIGEQKSGKVSFAETARTASVAGRTLDVTVKVQSIQKNEIPALSDETAKDLGYEGGAEGLRQAVRGELVEAREEQSRNQARANVLQALIDANAFDVPQSMIEEQLKALVEELRLQAAYRGRDPRQVTFSGPQMADLRIRAEFAVKGGLILEYVSKKEALAVSDADLEKKYEEMADERGQAVETIKGYFERDNAVEELRSRLLEEKTLDFLLEKSKLVEPKAKAAAT